MDHLKALAIKFIITLIVLFSILGIFNNATISNILLISALVTGVSYIVGDIFILPRFGNLIASIADFGLTFLSVWLLGALLFTPEFGLVPATLFIAALTTCTEAVFHIYMQTKVLDNEDEIYIDRSTVQHLQTEIGEENPNPDYIKKRENDSET